MEGTFSACQATTNYAIDHHNWQDIVMRIWLDHAGRTPTSTDIASFAHILDATQALIGERLFNAANKCFPPFRAPPHAQATSIVCPVASAAATPIGSSSRAYEANVVHSSGHIDSQSAQATGESPTAVQRQKSTSASKSLPFRLHQPDPTATRPLRRTPTQTLSSLLREPRWASSGALIPPVTLMALRSDIQSRKEKGCRHHQWEHGTSEGYPCTLGCGRSLASSADRKRHEEAVFPRDFWICYECSTGRSSRKPIFHRLDKVQKHSKDVHHGKLDIDSCKILDPPVQTPAACGLCPYQFLDRTDRDAHIDSCHGVHKTPTQDPVSTHERGQNIPLRHQSVFDQSWVGGNITVESSNSGPHLPSSPSKVVLHHLAANSGKAHYSPTSHTVAVQWLEVAGQCGVASVLRAEIAFDIRLGCASKPRTYKVKQYSSNHKTIFEQDKDACTQVATWENNQQIATCVGFFEDVAIDGRPTYNILLESTHDSLWDYWIDHPPPKTFRGIQNFYSKLFDLATDLDRLQKVREGQNAGLDRVLRGDITPEGIRVYTLPSQTDPELSGTFQLDTDYQSCTLIRFDSETGRRVFVVLIWFGCNSKLGLICGTADNEVDYDCEQVRSCTSGLDDSSTLEKIRRAELLSFSCVLSLAATWMTRGKAGLEALERAPLPQRHCSRDLHSSWISHSTNTSSGCAVATPNVYAWHDGLYRYIQPEDKITAQLLHLLNEQLFQPRTAHRMCASELKRRFRKILEDAALEWHMQNRSETDMDMSDIETDVQAGVFFHPSAIRRTQSFAAEMSEVDPGLWGIQPGWDGGDGMSQPWAAA